MGDKITGICALCMRRKRCQSPNRYLNITECKALKIHANRGRVKNGPNK